MTTLEHTALSADDRPLVETLLANRLADEAAILQCLEVAARAAELGVRLGLAEVLVARGVVGSGALESLLAVAGARRPDLGPLEATLDEEKRLGEMAVSNRLLTAQERDHALAAQARLDSQGIHVPLGKILVDQGRIGIEVAQGLLLLQKIGRREGAAGREPPFVEEDLKFGSLAVENGLATREELSAALREQVALRERGVAKRIGQVLFERGTMDPSAVRSVLRMQALLAGKAHPDELSLVRFTGAEERIGEVLKKNRLLTERELERALELQRELEGAGVRRRLGQLLLDLGLLDRDALESALEVQSSRRRVLDTQVLLKKIARPHPWVQAAAGVLLLALAVTFYLLVDRTMDESGRGGPAAASRAQGDEEEELLATPADHPRLLATADHRIHAHEYARAARLLEKLLERLKVPEWIRQAESRLEAASELALVLDELVRRIGETPVQVVELGEGERFEVVAGDEKRLVVRRAGEAGESAIPWSDVGAESIARLLDAYGVTERDPEGALRFYLEHGLSQRADRLAVEILRRSPDRKEAVLTRVGEYRGIENPVETIQVEDGRLVVRPKRP
ncbi:MAG: hypothetical protein HY720_10330 [Planctomycetes bacterium]|nr:hypothetical protein [Planctomycetota bacterium]